MDKPNLHAYRPGPRSRAQRGAALLVAMIFMVVLTILGIAVVGTTSTEEKMARNFRDQDIAFSAAEAALRDAELRVNGFWNGAIPQPVHWYDFDATCTDGLCNDTVTQPVFDSYTGTTIGTGESGAYATPTVATLSNQPRYLIEQVCRQAPGEAVGTSATSCQYVYRITATGLGRLSATVLLQEMFVP